MSIEKIDQAADILQLLEDRIISNLMYMIWQSRKDLQNAFDIGTYKGQKEFCQWYDVSVLREYGIAPNNHEKSAGMTEGQSTQTLSPQQIPLHIRLMECESTVGRISRFLPKPLRKIGKGIWLRLLVAAAHRAGQSNGNKDLGNNHPELSTQSILGTSGANLIGYAHAELGMGEHVRMTAAALATTDIQFGVVNFNVGVASRQKASLDHGELSKSNNYRANIFHVNADQVLKTYCHLGRNFFNNRYNILYPFWELAKWPDEWVSVLEIVDEVWAPSRFIQQAIASRTTVPVEYMPVCVTLPSLGQFDRHYFGLPENRYLFLFTFDFFSFIERKNPFAAIRAFKKAFPDRSTKVGLVIKVMNGNTRDKNWIRMMELIDKDHRIIVLNQTMNRQEILGLYAVTDCFVSLHRSEGFGRGPAEAMYLKKPVIVTNYSGNTDYTLSDNSCLVDYQLIPVGQEEYIFGEGQVWADPDIEQAAWYMQKLFEDSVYRENVAERGANLIHTKYSPESIAKYYTNRLRKLDLS